MKLRLISIIVITLFNHSLVIGADNYQVGDRLFVWATSGLNVRLKPGLNEKKLGKLNIGDLVEIISISDQKSSLKVVEARPELFLSSSMRGKGELDPYFLTGNWIKVKNENIEGFVIDSYLLKYCPPSIVIPMNEYIEMIENESLSIDTMYVDERGIVKDYYSYFAKSSSGIEFSGENLMSSVSFTVKFPEMTIEEGFVLLNYFYPLEDINRKKSKISLLKLMGSEKTLLWFLEDGMCEISISIEANELYISRGCSC